MAFLASLSFSGTAYASQSGYCWNEKIGWISMGGIQFNGAARTFNGSATFRDGSIDMTPQVNIHLTLSGQPDIQGNYRIVGQGFSEQIGWVFADHSGMDPAALKSTGQLTGNFWSNEIGWILCSSADVGPNAVQMWDGTATSIVLSSSQNSDQNTLILTATVSASDATGTVRFFDGLQSLGSVPLTNGKALLSLPAFSYTDTSHTFTATYDGSVQYSPSTSAPLTVTVRMSSNTSTATGGGRRTTPSSSSLSSSSRSIIRISSSSSIHSTSSSIASLAPRLVPQSVTSGVGSPQGVVESTQSHSSSSLVPRSLGEGGSVSSIRLTTVPVHLRSTYTKQSRSITQLPANTPVTLIEVLTDWAKVKTKNGKVGYVLRKFLRK